MLTFSRLEMRKRRNLCFTVFAKPRLQNWVLVLEQTAGHAWPAHAKVYASVSDGEARF